VHREERSAHGRVGARGDDRRTRGASIETRCGAAELDPHSVKTDDRSRRATSPRGRDDRRARSPAFVEPTIVPAATLRRRAAQSGRGSSRARAAGPRLRRQSRARPPRDDLVGDSPANSPTSSRNAKPARHRARREKIVNAAMTKSTPKLSWSPAANATATFYPSLASRATIHAPAPSRPNRMAGNRRRPSSWRFPSKPPRRV